MKKLFFAFVGLIILTGAGCNKQNNQVIPAASSANTYLYDNDYTSLQEDINGDGKKELIKLTVERFEGYVTTTLYVNELSVIVPGYDPAGYFDVVDIDNKDNVKEIAVIDIGPSDDYTTSFYYFNGTNLLSMGTIPWTYKDMTFNGFGKIITKTRGKILDTWFYDDDFVISENHELVHVPKKLYARDTTVTLLAELPLQTSSLNSKIITTLQKGEVAKIVGCDDIAWCVIKKSDGVDGWFAVENFDMVKDVGMHAQDVFLGLSNAD